MAISQVFDDFPKLPVEILGNLENLQNRQVFELVGAFEIVPGSMGPWGQSRGVWSELDKMGIPRAERHSKWRMCLFSQCWVQHIWLGDANQGSIQNAPIGGDARIGGDAPIGWVRNKNLEKHWFFKGHKNRSMKMHPKMHPLGVGCTHRGGMHLLGG